MDTIQLLASFAITGVVISAVAEYTKHLIEKTGHRTWYVLGLSVAGGLVVYFGHLIPGNIIKDIVGVWAAANTAYLAVVRYLPNTAPTDAPVNTETPAAPAA